MISRVLQVTLKYPENNQSIPVYLEQLAAEMLSEGHELILTKGDVERLLMERLSMPQDTLPQGAQETPLKYLVECYRRSLDESKKANASRNKEVVAQLQVSGSESATESQSCVFVFSWAEMASFWKVDVTNQPVLVTSSPVHLCWWHTFYFLVGFVCFCLFPCRLFLLCVTP